MSIENSILSAQSGAIKTITLNRPTALNSFNSTMHEQLLRALNEAAADGVTRCVLLTGAGRAFCAGQDLSDPYVAPDNGPEATAKDLGKVIEQFYKPLVERLRSMPVPVVVAVNGVAAGAGANIALNCDLVIAAQSAQFIQAFSKIGLIPDSGGTWLLPRLLGRARALGLALLGEKLSAVDAQRLGLIWKCVPDEAFLGEAQAIARSLAMMPTKALVSTRMAMDAAQSFGLTQALDAEVQLQRNLGFAHDYREGVNAFIDKRSPRYTDR